MQGLKKYCIDYILIFLCLTLEKVDSKKLSCLRCFDEQVNLMVRALFLCYSRNLYQS